MKKVELTAIISSGVSSAVVIQKVFRGFLYRTGFQCVLYSQIKNDFLNDCVTAEGSLQLFCLHYTHYLKSRVHHSKMKAQNVARWVNQFLEYVKQSSRRKEFLLNHKPGGDSLLHFGALCFHYTIIESLINFEF